MSNTKFSIAADISRSQREQWLSANRNLVACLDLGAEDLFKKIQADLVLDEDAEGALEAWGEHIDHADPSARKMAQEALACDTYRQICLAFLRLKARGAVQFSIEPTEEAADELYELEVASGCRRPKHAIAEEAAAQTVAESLDEIIKRDWNTLPTSQIQSKKKSDSQYALRLESMLNSGAL